MPTPRQQILNLADFMVEDIMSLSDEEVLREAEEDGIDLIEMRRDINRMIDRAFRIRDGERD